jgi:UDP-N-acetylmuramoylalanine--D-glutamate ligase
MARAKSDFTFLDYQFTLFTVCHDDHFLDMTTSILIFGLGITGQAALEYCLEQKLSVIAYDDREKKDWTPPAQAQVYFKEFPAELLSSLSGVILSPGVPPTHPLLQKIKTQGIPVESDIDYFAKRCLGKIIGITGSNGKSTVTALTTHLLNNMGFTAVACGNFGYPVMKLLGAAPYDYYVIELSSYQLEWTEHLNAQVGCLLNVTPNHLDRYGTMEKYQQAKERLFQQCEQLVLHTSIHPLQQPSTPILSFSEALESQALFHLKRTDNITHLYCGPDCIWTFPPGLMGPHQYANRLAALAIIHGLGLSTAQAAEHLASYQGLPHRLQRIPSQDGLVWINDSKSTTTAATVAALTTVSQEHGNSPIILLLGGVFKEHSLDPLLAVLKECRMKELIVYGRDASVFVQAFQDQWPVHETQTLEQAVMLAKRMAAPSDCILLSPACASLDQFPNFEVRGERFVEFILKKSPKN